MIDSSTLKDLEFDKVLEEISSRCRSPAGRKAVLGIAPFESSEEIEARRALIEELRRFIVEEGALALSRFEDISSALERVRPGGAILEPADFLDIRNILGVIKDVSCQLTGRPDLELLAGIASSLTGFPELLKLLDRSFDSEGNVVDGASPTLSSLRKKLKGLSGRVSSRLDELVRDENIAPFLQDDFVTKRGERWVIPVRMDAKGQVSGVVHDVSNTGETAFVEPIEIISMVNELENLSADEKGEVIRIKRSICDAIRDVAPDFERQFYVNVHLDLVNAIAEYADRYGMNAATIADSQTIRLKGASHPLLVAQQREGVIGKVVPLDFALEGDKRVMVITGPNAGGKTITIKTAGLLILMALSGIPVSADSSSLFPFAGKLLLDIGDEQSIENSMSTFSSHLFRISKIIDEADEKSVILLDEVGTGTEPLQGAAIACAVLNELKNKGAIVFATTHLTDIVVFVRKSGGMMNASMEFDRLSHTPLYKLKEGEPGQSHAIDAARRYGLPDSAIKFAREMMGGMNAEMQELISELKEKGAHYDEAKKAIELRAEEFALKEAELEAKLNDAREKAQTAYMEAYRE
ncbi:MAG: endonuclease MutS2, partial [bacterium]|nr:endonuclease MutS2 [bacterium]